jgi:hypothetical protein
VSSQASALNIIEQINATKFPAIFPDSTLLLLFEKNNNEINTYRAMVSMTLNNKKIGGADLNIDFKGSKRHRGIVTFPPLTLGEAGILKLDVLDSNEKSLGFYEVEIIQKPIIQNLQEAQKKNKKLK